MSFFRLSFILIKQYLKKPECLLLLLCLPLFTFLFSKTTQESEQQILAACYIPGIDASGISLAETASESELLFSLAKRLDQYGGLYGFYFCDSEEEVYRDVASNNAECGYIFPEELFDELVDGNYRELITTVASPSTTMLPLINEVVYSMIFVDLVPEALKQYLASDSAVSGEYSARRDDAAVDSLYQKYLLDDDAFHFEYQGSPKNFHLTTSSVLLSPVRGLLAVLMLLSALTGAISYYKLAEHPVFDTLKVRLLSVAIPVLAAFPVMLACIYFAGLDSGFLRELCSLLVYSLACIIGTFLLTLCIKKRVIFTSLLPILILACLVFTPVFIDVSLFLPVLKPVSYLFLPYYYLTW